jgi:hypothetical protein
VRDLESALASVEAALLDADARLSTDLGDRHEVAAARLWRGQVLVDWEPDPQAGDCLLRVELLRRLVDLGAKTRVAADEVRVQAPGRTVAALSNEHAALVRQLGGARRVEMSLRLRFADGVYVGGEETLALVERGRGRPIPLLRLSADVKVRPSHAASPRTSPAPR